jgi:hypothetical protein
MNIDIADWALRRTVKIYLAYHHILQARAQEGQPDLLQALFAVLLHEGLKVKLVEDLPDQPDSGRLIVEDRLNIHIVCIPKIDPEPVLGPAINSNSGLQTDWLTLNFGSSEPDYYPKPLDEIDQMEHFWEEIMHPQEDELDYEESEAEDVS